MRNMEWKQILVGVFALGLGIALYVLDRSPSQTYFLPDTLSLFSTTPSVFGKLGNHLPTFLHVFAFCLITSGVLNCGRQGTAVICILWLLVDAAFEIGQHQEVANKIVPHIPGWFEGIPFLENTENYFLKGRFDPADLAAILFGAIAAYFLTRVLHAKN